MFNKASTSKYSERGDSNKDWLTKQQFYEVFPRGYRDCNFFASSIEYWAMGKESLNKDNKEEPLINISSTLNLQNKLQDTYSIGHSSDTILLTELLRSKHEDPVIKSPAKKDGDIRVLFSKTTKSIKNYTKSVKELDVNNMNISTEVLNLLVDLSLENTATVKRCYICLTVCNCTKFTNKTLDESNRPLGLCSRSQPVLPDINLIDNIDTESLFKLAYENYCPIGGSDNFDMLVNLTPTESRPQLDNLSLQRYDELIWSSFEIGSENYPNIKQRTNIVDRKDEIIFEDIDHLIELDSDVEDIKNQSINNTDDLSMDSYIFADIDGIDDIEIRKTETNTKSKLQLDDTKRTSECSLQKIENENDIFTENVLKYFRLNNISDIFQDSDVDVEHINENNMSLLIQTRTRYNEKCNNINNQINVIPEERPSSPSLLSGRSISVRSTSPIPISQKRKINLSINKPKNELVEDSTKKMKF